MLVSLLPLVPLFAGLEDFEIANLAEVSDRAAGPGAEDRKPKTLKPNG